MIINSISNHISFNSKKTDRKAPIYNIPANTSKLYNKTESINWLLDRYNDTINNIKTLDEKISELENQTPKDTKTLFKLKFDKAFWTSLQIDLEKQINAMKNAPDEQKMRIELNTSN